MTSTGVVQNVTAYPLGSELYQAAAAGALTLLVHDGADFAEGAVLDAGAADDAGGVPGQAVLSGGGLIRVGGDDANAEIVRYSSITEPDDDEDADDEPSPGDVSIRGIGAGFGGAEEWYTAQAHPFLRADADTLVDDEEVEIGPATITLAAPLANAWPEGTRVDIWDAATASPATEWRALARPASDTDNTDAVDAVINYSLITLLPEGVRDPDEAELVTLDDSTGDWRVTDVISRVPEGPEGPARISAWASTTTASVPTNTWVVVTGWALDVDRYNAITNGPWWSTNPGSGGSPPGTITFTTPGLYQVEARITLGPSVNTGQRVTRLMKVTAAGVEQPIQFGAAYHFTQSDILGSWAMQFDVGDTLQVQAWQATGAAIAFAVTQRWQIRRLGAAG